jgi:hypothetical protein
VICISGTNEWGNVRPSSVRTTACKTLGLVKATVQCTTDVDALKQMLLALRVWNNRYCIWCPAAHKASTSLASGDRVCVHIWDQRALPHTRLDVLPSDAGNSDA